MSQYAGQYPQTCLFVIFRAVWRLQASGITIYSKAKTDGGVADRSVGCMIRASLHAYGGTFDSVTCHQRRYHYAHLRIMADSRAIGCIQRGVARSAVGVSLPTDNPGAPAARLPANGMYLLALFTCVRPHFTAFSHKSGDLSFVKKQYPHNRVRASSIQQYVSR